MINFGLKMFAMAGAFFHSYRSIENFADSATSQVDLERQMIQYNTGATIADPSIQLEQNEITLQRNAAQVALFGYAAYRLCSGNETSFDLAIGTGAALLTLYPRIKQGVSTVLESDAVQSLGRRVFHRVP